LAFIMGLTSIPPLGLRVFLSRPLILGWTASPQESCLAGGTKIAVFHAGGPYYWCLLKLSCSYTTELTSLLVKFT
jgi:hypothetical protein